MGGASTRSGQHHGWIHSTVLCLFQRIAQIHDMPTDKITSRCDESGHLVVREVEMRVGGKWPRQPQSRWGGCRGQGQGHDGGGACILDLHKQETLDTLNIAIGDTNHHTGAAS